SVRICETDSFLMQVNPENDVFYGWTDGLQGSERWIFNAGTYVMRATREMCTLMDTLHLYTDQMPLYEGNSVLDWCNTELGLKELYVNDSEFFAWIDSSQGPIKPTSEGFYPFYLKNGLCTKLDSIEVRVSQNPDLEDINQQLCKGDTAFVNIPLADDYTLIWQDGVRDKERFFVSSNKLKVAYSNDVCSNELWVDILFNKNPDFSSLRIPKVCEGNNYQIFAQASNNSTITWKEVGSSQSQNGTRFNGEAPLGGNPIQITVYLEDSLTMCKWDTVVSVQPDVHPQIEKDAAYISCNAPVNAEINSNADSVVWDNGSEGHNLFADSSGVRYLTAYKGLCITKDSVKVHVINQPPITLGPDTFICSDERYVIETPVPVQWSTGLYTDRIEISEEGMYSFIIEAMGCSQSDSIYVEKFHLPEISVKDTVACEDEIYTLPESYWEYDLVWEGVKPNSKGQLRDAGYYTFSAYGVCGDSTYNFRLDYRNCSYNLYLPNAFTPDGDGNNDWFRAVHEGFDRVKLQVFDRWGEIIFDGIGDDPAWDGTYRGQEAQNGVYSVVFQGFYTDKYGEAQKIQETGMVTLIR
ncbi:MAG: gliding motility-associated C-terminal domain-containing protein, partial [Luteibaculum sp.]